MHSPEKLCIRQEMARKSIVFPQANLFTRKTPDKLRSLAKVQYCAPRRNVAFSCKSIVLLIVSRSPEKLCVHSKNICISLKKYCVLLQKYSVPLRNSAFTRQSIVLQRNFAFTYETLRSPEKCCVHLNFCIFSQNVCKRTQCFSGDHKCFPRECKLSRGNENVLWTNAKFFRGTHFFAS